MSLFYSDDDAIARLGTAFLDLSLPKAEWTHAAHFATTLWLLGARPDIVPERDMPALIRAYNASVGGVNDDHNGYHETITQASIGAARAFLAERPAGEALHETVDALMAGPLGISGWPLVHWSRERLFSVAARRDWVRPDLAPLPFAEAEPFQAD
ncbi:hypothetical protein Q4F19_05805 [Sphingomonas sp. BIUV-7]|uniref:Uncharacterized protein n=1 Tax=Sphingomonas natans TaxID=3063330 RepID=A0ABT8Y6D2_9SPHN|nr:hypothetical protein [Sphingomonas sp. BIUV-7]MDO6413889.1 hypothetical protein [Sphingomonas sp. BIUV-7]